MNFEHKTHKAGGQRRSAPSRTSSLRATWEALLRLLYPPCCPGCGALLPSAGVPLCTRCVRLLERPSSEVIAARLARLPEASLDGGAALWFFDPGGTVQRVQHRLKYGNRPRSGLGLGRWMGEAYRTAGYPSPDLVVPVPLHRTRRLERGYNQSALLARGVAEALDVPSSDATLRRSRATRSQTRLSRRQRWDNVAGAFVVPIPHLVENRCLVLVDDVLTTGATLAAGALALKQAGAHAVYAATLALARG